MERKRTFLETRRGPARELVGVVVEVGSVKRAFDAHWRSTPDS